MRVVVNETFKMFYGHTPLKLEAGQVVTGSLAEVLARGARKRVTVLEDEQPGTGAGQQEPPPPPPPPGTGDPSVPPPAPVGELDIDAPVADVLAWVGDDSERAAEALRQELEVEKPRSTLVKQLTKIAGE
ncbi:hypothetical protein [Streptomyces hirsutus]|uniref:hypothetical protein n=1 Tax=Streptomyces hirsutus TaxID=35620 RepID=UPI003693C82B